MRLSLLCLLGLLKSPIHVHTVEIDVKVALDVGFDVFEGYDAFPGQNAPGSEVPFEGFEAAKTRCLSCGYDGFVLWNGKIFYRHQNRAQLLGAKSNEYESSSLYILKANVVSEALMRKKEDPLNAFECGPLNLNIGKKVQKFWNANEWSRNALDDAHAATGWELDPGNFSYEQFSFEVVALAKWKELQSAEATRGSMGMCDAAGIRIFIAGSLFMDEIYDEFVAKVQQTRKYMHEMQQNQTEGGDGIGGGGGKGGVVVSRGGESYRYTGKRWLFIRYSGLFMEAARSWALAVRKEACEEDGQSLSCLPTIVHIPFEMDSSSIMYLYYFLGMQPRPFTRKLVVASWHSRFPHKLTRYRQRGKPPHEGKVDMIKYLRRRYSDLIVDAGKRPVARRGGPYTVSIPAMTVRLRPESISKERLFADMRERRWLFSGSFSADIYRSRVSHFIRSKLWTFLSSSGECAFPRADSETLIEPGNFSPVPHMRCAAFCEGAHRKGHGCRSVKAMTNYEMMKSSKYCLHPAGDTLVRSEMYLSIILGCVPVLFDGLHELYAGGDKTMWPWRLDRRPSAGNRFALNYSSFAVIVDAKAVAKNPWVLLDAVKTADYISLRKGLGRVRSYFAYSQGVGAPDAFLKLANLASCVFSGASGSET